jgi:GNAT superfamily N-acetyltransferase
MSRLRKAIIGDEKEIQSFIFKAVDPENNPDFNADGVINFAKPNELPLIRMRISSPDYLVLCYLVDEKIVGLITMYLNEKLDQLFVDPHYRNNKIAKNLWLEAKKTCLENGNQKGFYVKSSTVAIPVYQSFGFCLMGGRQQSNGIVFYSMNLTL